MVLPKAGSHYEQFVIVQKKEDRKGRPRGLYKLTILDESYKSYAAVGEPWLPMVEPAA